MEDKTLRDIIFEKFENYSDKILRSIYNVINYYLLF